MAINPKVFISAIVIGGGFISTPLILWKKGYWKTTEVISETMSPATTATNQQKVSRKLPNVQNSSTQRGNCEIENLSEDYENFLIGQGKAEIYFEMSCENTNKGTGSGSLPHNWTGLFPESLFENGESFAVGQKLNIITETIVGERETKTIFKGGGLKSTVKGIWGESRRTRKSESVTPVLIDSGESKTIYWISG